MSKTNKYQCTMKLFDDSINLDVAEPLTATVFARTASEIPHVSKLGSIIRLHRVQTVKYKKSILINCDVTVKSAWVLFDPSEGASPIGESGKGHSFTAEERKLLATARKFAKNYFTTHELKGITFKQAERKPKDFDVVCYVMSVKKGSAFKATVCDAEKVIKLDIGKRRMNLVEGEVIRIRSANYTDRKCDKIELNEYSNVLRVAGEYKSAKQLTKQIDKVKPKATIQKLSTPIVGSRINTAHKQLKKVLLSDIFGASGDKLLHKCFKVHVNVREVSPRNPEEWIWAYDRKSKKQVPLNEAFRGKKQLPSTWVLFYKMQLYVQDKDCTNASMHPVTVSTLGGKCPDFLGRRLGREYPGKRELDELRGVYKVMTNKLVSLDLAVEVREVVRKQPIFSVVDTVLTI